MAELLEMEYNWGWFTNPELGAYVVLGTLTKDKYKEITGEDYVDSNQPAVTTAPAQPATNPTEAQASPTAN